MATDNTPMILIPVKRNKDGVDVKAILEAATKIVQDYAQDDQLATKAVVEVTENILTNKKYEKMTTITAGTLAKMALGAMQEIPTEKLCAETENRVKAYLQCQPEKFLHIERGRNAGFWFKDRLNATPEGKEILAKLLKEKATSDSAKAKVSAQNQAAE